MASTTLQKKDDSMKGVIFSAVLSARAARMRIMSTPCFHYSWCRDFIVRPGYFNLSRWDSSTN
jgi:hypothetical protein